MPKSLPALTAAILRSDHVWRVRSDSTRFESAELTGAYQMDASLDIEAQSERAAYHVAELARKLQRLPEAYAWWPLFEPGPYFDLHGAQTYSFCRVEELRTVVRVRIYADLLLPAFRRVEAYFIAAFLPAYHAATGAGHDDAFSRSLASDAIPTLAGLLTDAERAITETLQRLEDQIDVLALLGGLEERIQHRPQPGARLAPGLPENLQRLPRAMPTLTLDTVFASPQQHPQGREAWLRFQQERTMRQQTD